MDRWLLLLVLAGLAVIAAAITAIFMGWFPIE
jgi:hypothetical protein